MEDENPPPRRSTRLRSTVQPAAEPLAAPATPVKPKKQKAVKRPSPIDVKPPAPKKKPRASKAKPKNKENAENQSPEVPPAPHDDELDLAELEVPREWANLLQTDAPTSSKSTSVVEGNPQVDQMMSDDEQSDEEEEDWEDVAQQHHSPVKPTVQVHVKVENAAKAEAEKLLKNELFKASREMCEDLHKLNYLGFVSHLHFLMRCCLELKKKKAELPDLLDCDLSVLLAVPLDRALDEFRAKFQRVKKFDEDDEVPGFTTKAAVVARLEYMLENKKVETDRDLSMMFAVLFLAYDIDCRLCVGFTAQPDLLPSKPPPAKKKDAKEPKGKAKKEKETKPKGKKAKPKATPINYWAAFYDDERETWIPVHPVSKNICDPDEVEDSGEFMYAIAMDNAFGMRDVTARYASKYMSVASRKARVEDAWIKSIQTLPFLRANKKRSMVEDAQTREFLLAKDKPKALCEYKNHPLYVLEKDLLKFEAIYPPDTASLGTVREHAIFPRSHVHTLQGELNWIRMARSIRPGETPYKVVKARPKLSVPAEERVPLDLNVYGYWQTIDYERPKLVNGKIPRNEYGNVYMYQPEKMCPIDCVHLREKGVLAMAKSLDMQAVPAVIGWEFSGGRNHPLIDGCVVLKEDAAVLRSACRQWHKIRKEKKEKAAEDRNLGLWKRFVRGKFLLQKMKKRFNVKDE